jgi:hypothetical protein
MLIRAIDYMPPVHLTFGDVLSAVLTADAEVRPDDTWILRRAELVRSFAGYGIAPSSRRPDAPGIWETPPEGLSYARVHFESMRSDPEEVFRFLWENRELLELSEEAYTNVISVRPCVRVAPDGFTLRETVVEYSQRVKLSKDELREKGIRLPGGLAAKLAVRPNGNGKGAAFRRVRREDDGHEPAAGGRGGSLPLPSIEGRDLVSARVRAAQVPRAQPRPDAARQLSASPTCGRPRSSSSGTTRGTRTRASRHSIARAAWEGVAFPRKGGEPWPVRRASRSARTRSGSGTASS